MSIADFALEYGWDVLANPGLLLDPPRGGNESSDSDTTDGEVRTEGRWKVTHDSAPQHPDVASEEAETSDGADRVKLTIKQDNARIDQGISREAFDRLFLHGPVNVGQITDFELIRKLPGSSSDEEDMMFMDFFGAGPPSSHDQGARPAETGFTKFGACTDLSRGKWHRELAIKKARPPEERAGDTDDDADEVPSDLEQPLAVTENGRITGYHKHPNYVIFANSLYRFSALRSLTVNFPNVRKFVLTPKNCPALESLALKQLSEDLVALHFAVPHSLRYLQVEHCHRLHHCKLDLSLSCCFALKTLDLGRKNYGLARLGPVYLPNLRDLKAQGSCDLRRLVCYAPFLEESRVQLGGSQSSAWGYRIFRRSEFQDFVTLFLEHNAAHLPGLHEALQPFLNGSSQRDLSEQEFERILLQCRTPQLEKLADSGNEQYYSFTKYSKRAPPENDSKRRRVEENEEM
ncbi:unnamed protein product [Amoebophrya sp. A120]|nr:unnamed protein product [Amoebophrya sp. A120]|eukprot:GSA120T00003063001.1